MCSQWTSWALAGDGWREVCSDMPDSSRRATAAGEWPCELAGRAEGFVLVSLCFILILSGERGWLLAQPHHLLLAFALADAAPSSYASLQPAANNSSALGQVSFGKILMPSSYSGTDWDIWGLG